MLAALFATLALTSDGGRRLHLGGRSVDQHLVHPSPKLRVRAAELLIQPASGLVLLSAGSSVASGLEAHEKGGVNRKANIQPNVETDKFLIY
jgi:hypothetical protein